MIGFCITTGFMIGFLGSFHCVGMCGPIALSLPLHNKNKTEKALIIFLYNFGRAVTYAIFGALLGFISNRFLLVGYQQILSVVAGAGILVMLLITYFIPRHFNFFSGAFRKVQHLLGNALRGRKNTFSYLVIGLLNGLLPCGLVYLAAAASITTGSVAYGALMMFSFGLGTFPLMISLLVAGNYISLNWRKKIKNAMPYFIAFMGILLILRGMNLNIPYVSPHFSGTDKSEIVECH